MELTIQSIEETMTIYPNQKDIAKEIYDNIIVNPNKFIGLLVGLTQSGKTGVINAIVDIVKENAKYHFFEDIIVATGLSSVDWKKQTKNRLYDIKNNIYHRPDILKGMLKRVKKMESVIIILDEVHTAAKENQTIDRFFQEIGLDIRDKSKIKLIYISATPSCILKDILNIKDDVYEVFRMEMVSCYMGTEKLSQQNRIKDSMEYKKWNDTHITSLKQDIASFTTPRYHIFRIAEARKQNRDTSSAQDDRSIVLDLFTGKDIYVVEYNESDKDYVKENINTILFNRPSKHTVIFVKEKLRCAISIHKEHLGILYERIPHKIGGISVFIQGLVGRMCGYDDNGVSICYTDLNSVNIYNEAWKNENISVMNTLYEKETKNVVSFTSGEKIGLDVIDENINVKSSTDVHRVIFKTYDEMNEWILANIEGSRKKREKNRDENGFAITRFRNKEHIMNWDIVDQYKTSGLSFDKSSRRYFVVYDDLNDISTENHVIYYKK